VRAWLVALSRWARRALVARPAAAPAISVLSAIVLITLAGPSCTSRNEDTLAQIRRTGTLKVGTDATYPPFETVDPTTGQVSGFEIDLIRALAEQIPAKVEFVVVPFDGIIPGLKTGKYDLVISAMTITKERAAQILFTKPYTIAGQSIVVRAGENKVAGPADLVGKKIGCQLATTGELEAKKIARSQVVSFDTIGAAFRDLENGNLDGAIADTPTARIFIHDHATLKLAGEPLTREEFGMAVRPSDRTLAEGINQALDKLRAGGEMRTIEERWGIAAP
jgi:ABC-type amino acid transport substrate-binding protein